MKLIIRVEDIKGRCPAYEVGDRIVLDSGFRLNLEETTAGCMHSFASIIPYHIHPLPHRDLQGREARSGGPRAQRPR